MAELFTNSDRGKVVILTCSTSGDLRQMEVEEPSYLSLAHIVRDAARRRPDSFLTIADLREVSAQDGVTECPLIIIAVSDGDTDEPDATIIGAGFCLLPPEFDVDGNFDDECVRTEVAPDVKTSSGDSDFMLLGTDSSLTKYITWLKLRYKLLVGMPDAKSRKRFNKTEVRFVLNTDSGPAPFGLRAIAKTEGALYLAVTKIDENERSWSS